MKTGVLEWAAECRPLQGESACGDQCVVLEVTGGVLVGVIDGVGHGGEAATAAEAAVQTLETNGDRTFSALLQECDLALQGTRGAVMSLAFLDKHRTMTWIGVGNVEGRLFRRRVQYAEKSESLLLRTGVLGGDGESVHLASYYPRGVSVIRGDILVMYTDGISGDFEAEIDVSQEPGEIAGEIITNHCKPNDDALVLVGKYIG